MKVCVLNTNTLDLTVKNIGSNLESLQKEVGGLIEAFDFIEPLVNNGITTYCNEEGKLLNLKPSVVLCDRGAIVELLCGNLLFTGFDEDKGRSISLTDEQIRIIRRTFSSRNKVILYMGKFKIEVCRIDLD